MKSPLGQHPLGAPIAHVRIRAKLIQLVIERAHHILPRFIEGNDSVFITVRQDLRKHADRIIKRGGTLARVFHMQ